MTSAPDRVLIGVAIAHAAVAIACVLLLLVDAPPILGVHPAAKPLKFAISIALFLGSMAFLVPSLSASAATRRAIAMMLAATLTVEMCAISLQALRGRRSHFNLELPSDVVVVAVMFAGVATLIAAMLWVSGIAFARPMQSAGGDELPALRAWAWRAALVMFFIAVGSGIAMGARARHTVGGEDGDAGWPLANWSTRHGDLRVPHFFALHALQVIPVAARLISQLPAGRIARGAMLVSVITGYTALILWTWSSAIDGKPFARLPR